MSTGIGYTPNNLTSAAAEAASGTTHRSGVPFFNRSLSDTSAEKAIANQNKVVNLLADRVYEFAMQLAAESVSGLVIRVNAGVYRKTDGTLVSFPETALTLTDNATNNKVWIVVASNTLSQGTSWPASASDYVPICECTTLSGAITANTLTDRRSALMFFIPPAAAAIGGTNNTMFVIDQDNASASAAELDLVFNLGSSGGSILRWDAASTRFMLTDGAGAYRDLDGWAFYSAGILCISRTGKLQGVTIDIEQLYYFGANGNFNGRGIGLTPAAISGAPTSGVHTTGELHLDSAKTMWICTDGSLNTWKRLGDVSTSGLHVVSIPNSSGTSPRDVTIAILDNAGNAVAAETWLQVGVYQDANGADVATNATISVQTGTDVANGVHEGTAVGTKIKVCKTNSSGQLVIRVTNAVNETVYLIAGPAPRSPMIDCRDVGTVTTS
ncbi:MAG: hypothetical protein SF069_02940 [Phycisphaerae bacterium]|nr:hypothetical protein [Phycisphaerae bacterium]